MSPVEDEYNSGGLILINSPLNILAKFTVFLRDRFSQSNLPWQYSSNAADTDIHINVEYSLDKEIENLSPAVIVGRGSVVHGQTTVGDRDQNSNDELFVQGSNKYRMAEMDMRLQCIGQTYAEVSIVADIVQSAISMSQQILTKAFTLQNVGPVVASQVVPYERDEDKFSCNVDFRVTFEQRWYQVPAAPRLSGVKFSTRINDEAAEYVHTLTLIDTDV